VGAIPCVVRLLALQAEVSVLNIDDLYCVVSGLVPWSGVSQAAFLNADGAQPLL